MGDWLGTALGYIGVIFSMEQHDRNKNSKREIIKLDEDLLEDEDVLDVDESKYNCTITSNKHAKNYIERLTDKKSQEKIENRSRSVDVCIIDTEENQEDNIEL